MSADIRLSPRLLIAAASPLVGLASDQSGVALLQHCGYWSHFDHQSGRSCWPIHEAATPADLAAYGRAHNLLRLDPRVGDILLQFNPMRRSFVRAGLVVRVVRRGWWTPGRPYVDVLSIEGGVDDDGQLGGAHVLRVERRLSACYGDRFLRWADARADEVAAVISEAA
jgi:hypothetical protein